MRPAEPMPAVDPSRPDTSERARLSHRRRRTALALTALFGPLLLASWWMLRADARPLAETWQELRGAWQAAASSGMVALTDLRERSMARLSPLDAGPESRASRAGARLAHGPVLPVNNADARALEPAVAAPAEEGLREGTRETAEAGPASSGPASPEAAPPVAVAEPAPPAVTAQGSTGGLEVEADLGAVGDTLTGVGDTLAGLSPDDFRGALDPGVRVEIRDGGSSLPADLDVDVQPAAGAAEASARVAAPGASVELGASASLGPAAAVDVGTSLAAGPAGAGAEVHAGPGQLGAGVAVNGSGAPLAGDLDAQPGGVEIDVSTGGLLSGDLGSHLPVDLPLELRLH